MSRYLIDHYKGKYRMLVPYNMVTNDFPRDMNGNLEDSEDIYIKCQKGTQIFYYGKGILEAYIPSLGRGHNILKTIATDLKLNIDDYWDVILTKNNTENKIFNYYKLYTALVNTGKILYVSDTDAEVVFRFKNDEMSFFEKYLEPCTAGANTSPFSTKNLPKNKSYTISVEDLAVYKKITDAIPLENKLSISRITTQFFVYLSKNNKQYKNFDFKKDMKLKMLKSKEYIHSLGNDVWTQYINYLQENLNENNLFNHGSYIKWQNQCDQTSM